MLRRGCPIVRPRGSSSFDHRSLFSRRSLLELLLAALFVVPGTPTQAGEPKGPIDVGSRVELLLDDYLIASMRNLSFQLHSPQPAERVMNFVEHAWEVECGYVTVFKDGDRYRMYYASHLDAPSNTLGENQFTCYAESTDGIHWTKPSLGLVEFKGSKENNIIWRGEFSHNFAPFLDDRAGVPPEERYKAVGGCPQAVFLRFRRWYSLATVAGNFDSGQRREFRV